MAAGSLAVAPATAEAQSRLTGVVVDGETGEPISGAYVVLQGLRSIAGGTNSDGGFTLTGMAEGTYTLSVRHLAYREVVQEIVVVYRRVSEIPGEFGGSAAQCGVIAIWTRRGP